MNKIKILVIIVFISFFATGCVGNYEISEEPQTTGYLLLNQGSMYVYTFKDEQTGVWYISTNNGVTPRLNNDGTLYHE